MMINVFLENVTRVGLDTSKEQSARKKMKLDNKLIKSLKEKPQRKAILLTINELPQQNQLDSHIKRTPSVNSAPLTTNKDTNGTKSNGGTPKKRSIKPPSPISTEHMNVVFYGISEPTEDHVRDYETIKSILKDVVDHVSGWETYGKTERIGKYTKSRQEIRPLCVTLKKKVAEEVLLRKEFGNGIYIYSHKT